MNTRFTHRYRASQAWGEVKKVLFWQKENEKFFDKLVERAQKVSPGNGSTALIAGRKREQGAEDELYISLHAFDYFMICLMRHPLNERAFIPVHSSLTHALTHSLTHPLTHFFTYSLTHSLTYSFTYSLTH